MKRNYLVEIIAALFILLFVYTASSKLYDLNDFRYVLTFSPLLNPAAGLISWSLPLIEIIISLLLFFPRTRRVGLWSSLIIMILFTGYLTYMVYFTPHHPCSCGGVISKMTWKQHIVFNLFFTLLAALGLWLDKRRTEQYSSHLTYSASA